STPITTNNNYNANCSMSVNLQPNQVVTATATDMNGNTSEFSNWLAMTSTTVTSNNNPSTFGQSVTFTATVTSGAGTPTQGTVTFKDGNTNLGTTPLVQSGQASFTTSSLGAGMHSLTAVYSGSLNFSDSTSDVLNQQVNPAPTNTTVASNHNPSNHGDPVTFTATVTDGSGGTPTGSVNFLDGPTILGIGTLNGTGQASFTTSSLAPAAHSITAVYGGCGYF